MAHGVVVGQGVVGGHGQGVVISGQAHRGDGL